MTLKRTAWVPARVTAAVILSLLTVFIGTCMTTRTTVPEPPRERRVAPLDSFTPEMRAKLPATVRVIFMVEPDGSVREPKVLSSTDPAFEDAALHVVRTWRFEPEMKDGRPVRTRMMVPVTFAAE